MNGLIISNIIVRRFFSFKNFSKMEEGGFSGFLVRDMFTKIIVDMYRLINGRNYYFRVRLYVNS